MSNEYFNKTGNPQTNSIGQSSLIRAEFSAIEQGFAKLPTISGNGGEFVKVNSGATALESTNDASSLTNTIAPQTLAATAKSTPVDADLIPIVDTEALNVLKKITWANIKATLKSYFDSVTTTLTNKTIALGSNTVSGTLSQFNAAVSDADLASIAGTETLTNKTINSPILVTPNIGAASGTSLSLSGAVTATSLNSITGLASTTPAALGTAAVGSSVTVARSDHVHQLPSLGTLGAQPAGTYVTSVSGTTPVVSSGGTTPAISMAAATSSVNGYMSSAYAAKLDGIAAGAQVNVATNIGQGTLTSTTIPLTSSTGSGTTLPAATTSLAGLLTSSDKSKLDGIASGAQVNVGTNIGQGTLTSTTIPLTSSTGSGTTLPAATTSLAGLMSSSDKSKLDGVAASANNYTHPANHAPSIITQDASNRFVTDAEKSTWNSKQAGGSYVTGAYAAGNGSGNVPVSNGTVNSNLNADLLDGQHGSYYQPASTAITTSNIGSQTVAACSGNAATATYANTASTATNATSCSGNSSTASAVAWTGVYSKPTTISGYGITDVSSGTFTPTLYGSGSNNVSGYTAYQGQWIRIGNVVTVSGKFDLDAAAANTYTQMTMSLPVGSNITAAENLAGAAFRSGDYGIQGACQILGDASTDRAVFNGYPSDANNAAYSYTYTYLVQ